jgi:hypothetical protein
MSLIKKINGIIFALMMVTAAVTVQERFALQQAFGYDHSTNTLKNFYFLYSNFNTNANTDNSDYRVNQSIGLISVRSLILIKIVCTYTKVDSC